jgi:hypothetical protein
MKVYVQKQSQPQQKASLHPSPLAQHKILNQAVPMSSHVDAEGRKVVTGTSATTRFAYDFSRIPVHSKSPVMLQTKCTCGSRCSKCQNEQQSQEHLQTKSLRADDFEKTVVPPIVHEVLRSSGQPLDTSTREFMEARFGHDFSRVRVHTDPKAVEATQSVNALAFTVRQDIAFGRNKYSPQSPSGRELLAHELVHVMQQSSSPSLLRMPLKISGPSDEFEREADRVAKYVLHPSNGVRQLAEPYIQRMPSNQSQGQNTQRQTNKQDIDPRCKQKMEEYFNEHWLKELEEKYKDKTCADYDEFKTEVMSKLGATEFQTFGEGGGSYQCCVKYIAALTICGPPNPITNFGKESTEPRHVDYKVLESDYPHMMAVDKDIPLSDGSMFQLAYDLAQIPPEQCQEQPIV